MKQFIKQIQNTGLTSDIIVELLKLHKADRERMMKLYERYKAEIGGVPILSRSAIEYEDFETGTVKRIDNKVNNTLNNSFDAEIVDTKVGYMFGHAISYDSDNKTIKKEVEDFNLRNNVEDEDSEWGKKAAICGYGARLVYVDKEGNERIININPWECIFLSDRDMSEPTYSLRYYPTGDRDQYKIEFYDNEKVYFWEQKGANSYELVEEKNHLAEYTPLFGLPNNEELKGDAEKVLKLIDAYDRTLSDASNEIEQYRLAFMIFKGIVASDESLDEATKRGIIELMDEKEDVSYLTKDINDTMIENHLNRLEENIMRFAKSVNFADESFGNVTGVALRFKLMALENKCITMERKMTASLRYQYKVLCSMWAKRKPGITQDDYLSIWFGFKRNLPANLLEEAQMTASLKGLVSEETRLSLLSFVDDIQWEIGRMEEEGLKIIELGDDDEPTEEV